MDSRLQDELLASFAAEIEEQPQGLDEILTTAAELLDGFDEAHVSDNLLSRVVGQDAAATTSVVASQPTAAPSNASTGTGAGSSTTATILKSGFGLLPLIGALAGLFGGGHSEAPEPLVKYAMPAPLDFETVETERGLSIVDFDQFGMARAYETEAASRPVTKRGEAGDSGATGHVITAGPQITVNVQAMDARSFLDRSGDIAAAVRNAMLNLNPINDVVNDL